MAMSYGLVLSGGGAYGLANAGVADVLWREGLIPHFIAGSSMGAIVGALAALGHEPATLRSVARKISLWNVASPSGTPFATGLHGGMLRQNLAAHLEPLIGSKCIGDCRIPFVCIAGKIKEPITWRKAISTGFIDHVQDRVEKHVFPPETPIMDALMATSAIPVIFSPYAIGNDSFVDLCTFGAVPARTLRELHGPDIVIATDTTPDYRSLEPWLPRGMRDFLQASQTSLRESLDACDLVIRPELHGGIARFDRALQYVEAGETAAKNAILEVRTLLA